MSLFEELKRRNVVKVAVLYVVASWLILQVADALFPNLGAPDWAFGFVLGLLLLFFVPALIFSWVYELTPEGLKREKEIDRSQSITGTTGQKMNILIVSAFALLLPNLFAVSISAGAEQTDGGGRADVEAETGTLTVRVQGLASSDGNLRFVLFDSRENFLKNPVRAEIVEIKNRQGTWTIEELAYGTYAALVHHDINANGKMERHWYGKPKEPTGASNDAPARFGPPKFKDAKFQLESPTLTLMVTIK